MTINYEQLPSVLLLSRGWDHDQWLGFYPDDLPEEWRLGYYSNVFRAVLVPSGVIGPTTGFSQWLEDVHDQFLFYFESDIDPGQLSRARTQLGDRLGGVVCGPEATTTGQIRCAGDAATLTTNPDCRCFRLPAEAPFELKQLRQVVETLAERGSEGPPALLIIDGDPPDFLRLEQCQTLLSLMAIA